MKKFKKVQFVFVANDGKEFTNEEECLNYETETLAKKKNTTYWSVLHCPDLTEG